MGPKPYTPTKIQIKEVPFTYGSGYDVFKKPDTPPKDYGPQPDGKDHGSATKMLMSYMDEVLTRTRLTDTKQVVPQAPPQRMSKAFNESTFIEKLKHKQMKDMPLTSQKARQQAIWPVHSTDKKKRVGDIASRLKRNDGSLVRCRLNSEGMDDLMLGVISKALPKNIFLQHLLLHDNAITDEGVEALCTALRWHPSLHSIWLGGNQLSDVSAQHIATLLGRNHNITDVNISNRWPRRTWTELEQMMHPHITNVGAECIARKLQKCCGLTSLSLCDQRVRDSGAAFIFRALIPSRLRSLNLGGNELTDKSMPHLFDALASNPNLEKLVLKKNAIADNGTTLIAKALMRNGVLQALDLSDNNIHAQGLQALVDCLNYNHVLSSIMTVGNPGSKEDCRAEDIVQMRVHGRQQVVDHDERTDDTSYKIGYTQVVTDEHTDYGNTGRAPPTPNTQAVLDGIAEIGRGATPLPRSLTGSTGLSPPGSRHVASRERMEKLRLGTPPSTDGHGRSPSRERRRRDAGSPLQTAGVGTSGLRPLSRDLRPGTTERTFRYEGEDEDDFNRTMSQEGNTHVGGTASFNVMSPPSSPAGMSSPLLSSSHGASAGTIAPSSPMGVSQGRLADKPSAYGPYKDFAPYGNRDDSSSRTVRSRGGGTPSTAGKRLGSGLEQDGSTTDMEGFRGLFASGEEASVGDEKGLPSSPTAVGRHTSSRGKSRGGGSPDKQQQQRAVGEVVHTPRRGLSSRELGKTTRIPKTGSSGIRPIRVVDRHRDSGPGGHLLYLRVATPNDAPGDRPYSLLDIAREHEEALAAERAYRQTEAYKMKKEEKFREIEIKGPLNPSKNALRPAPPSFWETWRKRNHSQYPKGIDNASGSTSNYVDPRSIEHGGYDTTFLGLVRAEKELGIKNYKEPPNKVTTPAEAFVMRRREARVRRTLQYKVETETDPVERMNLLKSEFAAAAGLKPDEHLQELVDKSGLTQQVSLNERKKDFQARKIVVH